MTRELAVFIFFSLKLARKGKKERRRERGGGERREEEKRLLLATLFALQFEKHNRSSGTHSLTGTRTLSFCFCTSHIKVNILQFQRATIETAQMFTRLLAIGSDRIPEQQRCYDAVLHPPPPHPATFRTRYNLALHNPPPLRIRNADHSLARLPYTYNTHAAFPCSRVTSRLRARSVAFLLPSSGVAFAMGLGISGCGRKLASWRLACVRPAPVESSKSPASDSLSRAMRHVRRERRRAAPRRAYITCTARARQNRKQGCRRTPRSTQFAREKKILCRSGGDASTFHARAFPGISAFACATRASE